MEDILKEITDKQKEISLLYTRLRRTMRLYEHDTKLLSIQKINRATEDLKHVSTIINNVNRVKDAIWLYEHKGIDSGLIIKSLNSICEIVGVKEIQFKNEE